MDTATIKSWDEQARRNFTYVSDGVFDTWRSHKADVLAGRPWEGDCDDLCSTTLDLMTSDGLLLELTWRLFVSSAYDGQVDHMVGAVRDAEGGFWVVGDTFQPAYSALTKLHQIIEYQRMDEWHPDGSPVIRAGAPWD